MIGNLLPFLMFGILALSLSVEIPYWYTIQSMVYGVALFSLVFQAPVYSFLAAKKLPSGSTMAQVGQQKTP